MAGTITRALIGVRSLFFFVRKIAAQNEFLQFAVSSMLATIANALKPVLDFIANILIGFAKIVGRIFNVAVGISGSANATAGNTEQMLTIANFDELETLNKSMSGGSGSGGVEGGYDSILDKIDAKLGWIYKIIDKIKQVIKDNLPGGKNTTETGVPRVTEQASQNVYGVSSVGYNLIPDGQGGLINLKQVEDNADKIKSKLSNLKQWWSELKESVTNNEDAISKNIKTNTDSRVTAWKDFFDYIKGGDVEVTTSLLTQDQIRSNTWENFKEGVKSKWQDFKNTYKSVNEEMTRNQTAQTDLQVQRWQNFFQRVKEVWENIKSGFSTTWTHITDGVSQAVERAKTLIGGISDKVGELAGNAWGKVKGFGNTIIDGVESAINNLVYGINNSAFLTNFNRLFKTHISLSYVGIPRLASGGVLSTPTIAQLGEYPGARSNPEIAAPSSMLRDIVDNSNGELASVFAQVGRQIIAAIDQKDLEVSIGDTTIAKAAARGNRSWQLQTGNSLF